MKKWCSRKGLAALMTAVMLAFLLAACDSTAVGTKSGDNGTDKEAVFTETKDEAAEPSAEGGAVQQTSAESAAGASSKSGEVSQGQESEKEADAGAAQETSANSQSAADTAVGAEQGEGAADAAVSKAAAADAASGTAAEGAAEASSAKTASGEAVAAEAASVKTASEETASAGAASANPASGEAASAGAASATVASAAAGTASGESASAKAGTAAEESASAAVGTATEEAATAKEASAEAATASTQGGTAKTEAAVALEITGSPSDADVRTGESAVFTVKAQGTGLKYRWEKMKPSKKEWEKSSADGSKTDTLNVTEVKADWNGMMYRCKVTDAAGNTKYSDTAYLYVLSVTENPSSQYVRVGNDAVFRAGANGKGLSYQWQSMTDSDEEWKDIGGSGAKKASFTVEDAKAGWNRNKYRCKITDAAGKSVYTTSARLFVLCIRSNPKTQYTTVGKIVTFKTSATGGGVEYQWQVKKASGGDWKNSSGTGNRTKKLKVRGVTDSNGARYRCKVTDAKGNVAYTDEARFYVLGIRKNPSDRSVKPDERASFTVKATGSGLTYQWQYKKSSGGEWKNSSDSGSKSSTLKVRAKSSYNGRRYRCRVRDKKGHTVYSNSAVLHVAVITKNPSTRKIREDETAVFSVKASGSGLRYSWQMRRNSDSSWKEAAGSGRTTNTLRVKGRTSLNGYQFRCRVKTSGGSSMYSKTARLYVLGITREPSDRLSPAGKTASFHVGAVGPGLKYQWQFRKKSGGWDNYTGAGNKKATMKITATNSRDGMRFRCRVKDNAGNVVYSQTAYLWIFK